MEMLDFGWKGGFARYRKLFRMEGSKRQTLHDTNRLKPLLSWLEKSCPQLVPVLRRAKKNYEKQAL